MKTLAQWRAAEVARMVEEHGCTAEEAEECLHPSGGDWWKYIQKSLDDGLCAPFSVCRSIADNGYPFWWIVKHWPEQVPANVMAKTGRKA